MDSGTSSDDRTYPLGLPVDAAGCATVSLADAARILGVHRSTAWELYRRGEFPIPVLRIGTRLRVSLVQLGRFLEGGSDAA